MPWGHETFEGKHQQYFLNASYFYNSEQIDEAYQVLKQGKALRLVQTGEDIREGKSMKKSIADPVFWKALFSKKSSLIEEDDGRGKKSFFGGLMSVSNFIHKKFQICKSFSEINKNAESSST